MIHVEGRWLCCTNCLEAEAHARFAYMSVPRDSTPKHRVPLGLLLLARGYLNEDQLQAVLSAQLRARQGKIGAWAQKLNFVSERQVLSGLSLQWSCPLLALQTPPDATCSRMLPRELLAALRMMPVRFVRSPRLLYLAVCEGIDHGALAAIEQMLDCHAVPCLVSDRVMDGWLGEESTSKSPPVQVLEKSSGAAEMLRITASYASRLSADGVRIARCGHYGWVRLTAAGSTSDLLFDLRSRPACLLELREALSAAV
jgi:hypothetical protein